MSWLFSDSKKDTTKTFWRIDSASVSVTVVTVETGVVLYYKVQPIELFFLDERHQYDQLIHHVEGLMYRMIKELYYSIPTPSEYAVVVLGEPWAHTIKRQISYKRKVPFKLTKTVVKDLIDRDIKRLTQEYTTRMKSPIELMTPTYHELLIGGHAIQNPWGTMVTDVRFEYTTGFSDNRLTDSITAIIHEKMKIRLLHIHIDHYLNYVMRFWRTLSITNGMVINPSGLVTDISVFQQATLSQSGTLPSGLLGIRRELATLMNIDTDELKVLLSLFHKNILDQATKDRLYKNMNYVYQKWEKDFQKFASNAVVHGDIIDQVIWMGDSDDVVLVYFMHRLRENTLAFPLIFGSTHVGFSHCDTILETAGTLFKEMQSDDHIMLLASGLVQ